MKSCRLHLSKGFYVRVEVEHEQLSFDLKDENFVAQIKDVKDAGRSVDIPARLLAHLRYYACFNDALKNRLQSGLIFCSYYNFSSEKSRIQVARSDEAEQGVEPKIVLRSFVSLDGDVIHQVLEKLLKQGNCEEVISVHYWLVAQILNRLRSDFNLLTWQLALFSPTCTIAGALILPEVYASAWVTVLALFFILFLVALLGVVTTTVHNWLDNRFRKPNNQQTVIKTFDTLYNRCQITPQQVRTILQAHSKGSSLRDISRITGLGYETVVTVDAARRKAQILHNGRFRSPRADWLARVDLCLSIALVILILYLLKDVVRTSMLAAGLGALALWLFLAIIYHWLVKHLQTPPAQLNIFIGLIAALFTFVPVQNLSLFTTLFNVLLVALFPLFKWVLRLFVPLMSQLLIRQLLSPNYILRSALKQIFA